MFIWNKIRNQDIKFMQLTLQLDWKPYLTRKTICIIVFPFTALLVIYGTRFSVRPSIPIVKVSEFDKAVQIISRLRTNSTSLYGRPYRSMICTIVRNDPHLLEFLLRNLITGFSHIVLYDNNRIEAGYDTNISALIAPFIAAGVLTHVSWNQNSSGLLENSMKNGNSGQCLQKYSNKSDWVAILDTDEYVYYGIKNRAVDTLDILLKELERDKVCGVRIPWTMMYGEAKMLKQDMSLLQAYPRECGMHGLSKPIGRTDLTSFFNIPHEISCIKSPYTVKMLPPSKTSTLALIHYYSKSMEEYLIKAEQSVVPYIRMPIKTYDLGPSCTLIKFIYTKDYVDTFLHAYKKLQTMDSIKVTHLLPLSPLNVKIMTDYSLYMYLKFRCAQRHEFDNEKYLATNQDAKEQVKKGTIADGLFHFMNNFLKGAVGCWKAENRSFCD